MSGGTIVCGRPLTKAVAGVRHAQFPGLESAVAAGPCYVRDQVGIKAYFRCTSSLAKAV